MEYTDLVNLRSSFFQQAFANNYDLAALPQSLLGVKINLQSLHNFLQEVQSHIFFTSKISDRGTISSLRNECNFPILGNLYSTTKSVVNSRYRISVKEKQKVIRVAEVQTIDELSLPGTHLVISTKEKNFCTLCGMINEERTSGDFANIFVPREANQFLHYVRNLALLFPEKWVTYYVDITLATSYLGPHYTDIVNQVLQEFITRISDWPNFPIKLNTKIFSNVQSLIQIVCPGVVVGYLPALLIYGELLGEIMTIPKYAGGK